MKAPTRKPKEPTAIVHMRPNEQDASRLPATAQLPLSLLAHASKPTVQQLALDRLGRAENGQRAIADLLRNVVWDLVTAELARMVTDGVLEQVETPKSKAAAELEQQKAFLRIRASEILAQENSDFEPWFQPQPLSTAIMRQCKIDRRRVWKHYFSLHGCHCCKRKDQSHVAHGFCQPCWGRTFSRWQQIIKNPEAFED